MKYQGTKAASLVHGSNMESAPFALAFFETVAGPIAASKKRARAARKTARLGSKGAL